LLFQLVNYELGLVFQHGQLASILQYHIFERVVYSRYAKLVRIPFERLFEFLDATIAQLYFGQAKHQIATLALGRVGLSERVTYFLNERFALFVAFDKREQIGNDVFERFFAKRVGTTASTKLTYNIGH